MILTGLISLMLSTGSPGVSPDSCLTDAALRQIDASWEQAILEGESDFLATLLADDFVWVHNHASAIDSKESLLKWVSEDGSSMQSRVQSEVETRRLEKTAIVMGYTVVTRPDSRYRYRFMRTYVETSDGCLLLANQTMAIPEE